MNMQHNLLFRWSVGHQDTSNFDEYKKEQYLNLLWLTKISVISFQKWFPKSEFYILYNGHDIESFISEINTIKPDFLEHVNILDQSSFREENKYTFYSLDSGVWMKWIPFRIDQTKTEIAVDTDIICLNEPKSWISWIECDSSKILVAPERSNIVSSGSCGDFSNHFMLKGKKPINCGVVGQRAEYNYEDRFFEIAETVQYGDTRNSLFITEQGAINMWVYSLEEEGIGHKVLDFEKNTWGRDFIYFLSRGISVETVHAVAWQKRVLLYMRSFIEKKIMKDYSDQMFMADIISCSKKLPDVVQLFISKQIKGESAMEQDFLIQDGYNFKELPQGKSDGI